VVVVLDVRDFDVEHYFVDQLVVDDFHQGVL